MRVQPLTFFVFFNLPLPVHADDIETDHRFAQILKETEDLAGPAAEKSPSVDRRQSSKQPQRSAPRQFTQMNFDAEKFRKANANLSSPPPEPPKQERQRSILGQSSVSAYGGAMKSRSGKVNKSLFNDDEEDLMNNILNSN